MVELLIITFFFLAIECKIKKQQQQQRAGNSDNWIQVTGIEWVYIPYKPCHSRISMQLNRLSFLFVYKICGLMCTIEKSKRRKIKFKCLRLK